MTLKGEMTSNKIGRPTIRNRVYNLCRRLRLYGFKRTLSLCIDKLTRRSNHTTPAMPITIPSSDLARFFSRHDHLTVEDLRIQSHTPQWSLPYEASSENYFRRAMQHIPAEVNDYVFVDIGSGKGFVLLLAAEFPFKTIIGVEFSQTLAAIALENIRRCDKRRRQCFDIQCVCADGTEFVLPPEPTILYLFNPFQGPIMDRMIDNIKQSLRQHPRDFWILYLNPMENRKFRRSAEFRLIHEDRDFSVFRSRLTHPNAVV